MFLPRFIGILQPLTSGTCIPRPVIWSDPMKGKSTMLSWACKIQAVENIHYTGYASGTVYQTEELKRVQADPIALISMHRLPAHEPLQLIYPGRYSALELLHSFFKTTLPSCKAFTQAATFWWHAGKQSAVCDTDCAVPEVGNVSLQTGSIQASWTWERCWALCGAQPAAASW